MLNTMNIYRHFKGGYYVVLSQATVEETGEQVVIYQSLQDGRVWTRPLSVFLEPVPSDKENPTGQTMRFERVTNFNNQLNMIPTDKLMTELLSRDDCPSELQSLDPDKVWREEYLIGMFRDVYVDREHTHEDFFFQKSADTFEEAVEKLKNMGDTRMQILKRVYIKQDFD